MVDFTLSDTAQRLEAEARRFGQEVLLPTAAEREAAHRIPLELIRHLGGLGLLGVNIPKTLGGSEAGVVAYAAAVRQIAEADAAVAVTMAVTNMVAEVITKFGTPEQRERYVPMLVRGEVVGGAFGLSEPGAGSDAGSLSTRAERDGDRWRITGQKMWITTGDQAGVVVVWARTGEAGAKGISCFLVDGDAPGLTAGKPEEKMGLRASHTVALSLDGVVVPDSARLGELGQGFRIAMTALDGGRIGIGAQANGIGRAALSLAQRHFASRNVREPDALASQALLADTATELDAAWLLVLRAAWLKENGRAFTQEAAMAKLFSSEAANRATRAVVQLLGPFGYLEASGAPRLMRDCRVTQIYEGTSEIQRLVIGRGVVNSA